MGGRERVVGVALWFYCFGGNVFECLSGFCNTIQLKFDNR